VLIHVPQHDSHVLRHFSILQPSSENSYVDIVAKIIPGGAASMYFSKMELHEDVILQGPIGLFTFKESPRDKIFLATGTGIAPIISMLNSNMKHVTCNIKLFWGLKRFENVYFLDELKKLAAEIPNFEFKICLSQEHDLLIIPEEDRKYFISGRVNKGLEEMLHATSYMLHDYYVCGGRDAVESLRQYLYEKGAPKEQVFFEKF
jgi:ferredoxin-NADP reductase